MRRQRKTGWEKGGRGFALLFLLLGVMREWEKRECHERGCCCLPQWIDLMKTRPTEWPFDLGCRQFQKG